MRLRCYVTIRGSLFRLPSTVWQRMYSVDALRWKGIHALEAIARAGDVVRFPADSELPDPYDGLIPGQESLKVHACVGLPLFAGQNLIGALTLDGMQPDQFDVFSDEELRLIAALAAGALSNALLIEQLESQNMMPGDATPFEAVKQTQMIGLSPGMTQLKKRLRLWRRPISTS